MNPKFEKEIILNYIEEFYNDPLASRHLDIYLKAFDKGFSSGIEHAGEYVHGWHSNMDRMHEGITKGLLEEVEAGVRDLEYGDT